MADKENSQSTTQKQKPQFKIITNAVPSKNNGDKAHGNKEIAHLRKNVSHLNSKIDNLDKKMDRILELLLSQKTTNDRKPIERNLPSTTKKQMATKNSDVVILETPVSNRNVANIMGQPKGTSTPVHRIGFPPTPIHLFSPIQLVGRENVTNSHGGFVADNKTPANPIRQPMKLPEKAVMIELDNLNVEAVHVEAVHVEVVDVKDIRKEDDVNVEDIRKEVNKSPTKKPINNEDEEESPQNYIPMCMINSRSRARKQKQSAALKRISPALLAPITQPTEDNKREEREPANIEVPTNEASQLTAETKPMNVLPDCVMESGPIRATQNRNDFTLDSTTKSDQTADFLNVIVSAKANKIAAPIITLDKSDKNEKPIQVEEIIALSNLTQNELPEVARNSPMPIVEQTEEVKEKPLTTKAKLKHKSQPLTTVKSKKQPAKKKTLPVRLENILLEETENQGRAKRRAAPQNLAEPKLNKKLRR